MDFDLDTSSLISVPGQVFDCIVDNDYTHKQHRVFELTDERALDEPCFSNVREQRLPPTWQQAVSFHPVPDTSFRDALVKADAAVPYEKKKTNCFLCGTLLLRKTLSRHIQQRHLGETKHKCDVCDQSFKRRDMLQRHEREQHGDDCEAVECVYCGKPIKRRVMSTHFETRKCLAAREKQTDSTRGELAHQPSTQFMTDNMDAVMLCSQFYGVAMIVDFWLESNPWTAIPARFRHEYCIARSRTLRFIREQLCEASTSLAWALAIFLLYSADSWVFGIESSECEAHLKFLKSFRTTASSIALTAHAIRRQFDEILLYCVRSLINLLKLFKCSDDELERMGLGQELELGHLETMLSLLDAEDPDDDLGELEGGHDGILRFEEILGLQPGV